MNDAQLRCEESIIAAMPNNNNNSSGAFGGGIAKRTVTFPQLLIRYGADFAPRHTDAAVCAIFATIAGTKPSHLRPNSAIRLSELKSTKPIRAWCDKELTPNSIARSRWLAVADGLDDPEAQAEIDQLTADVVPMPPQLNRTDMEKRIFGDRLPNGAPVPPPAVITLDQWRYVVYGSPHLLPLVIALRLSVDAPDDPATRPFQGGSAMGHHPR